MEAALPWAAWGPGPGGGVGRAGAVGGCGLEGRQGPLGAGQSVDWWFWHFVCMLLFFSNQEAGFGIYVCLIPWDLVGDKVGLERAMEVKFLLASNLGHSSPQLPGSLMCSELMWIVGNQVWKFKNKYMRWAIQAPLRPDWRGERGEERPA